MNINFKIAYIFILFALTACINTNGDQMSAIFFDGERYNDDRMFVIFVARCTTRETDEFVRTIIHYKDAPKKHNWCVATYKNVERYMAYRVDNFETELEAKEYLFKVEPQTPLISLGGNSPSKPMSFKGYSIWKEENYYKDYDYKKMFPFVGEKPEEVITRWKNKKQ